MIFNSVTFLLFLPAVVAIYWRLPLRGRQWLIVLSSLAFYGFWRPEFTLVMLASASTDYIVALRMDRESEDRRRRGWLYLSFAVNLGFLLYFKYLFFVVDNGVASLHLLGVELPRPVFQIILPLGISFYTFETISYSVDVYRRTIRPEKDFLAYACFITFFPKLIAGPILRAHQLLPQLNRQAVFSVADMAEGCRRVLVGLFLKVGLADNIAPLVDEGFLQRPELLSALDVWTLAFLFGFQIYFDFSAYSHIAIGCSRLMGINLVENFNFPYTAASPRDFWQRWHMSLSGWIRDYLYLPLMGTRPRRDGSSAAMVTGDKVESPAGAITMGRRSAALFGTWAIMGLWHGANWTFLMWGLFHAICIYGNRLVEPLKSAVPARLRAAIGLSLTVPLMMAAWIPFRAQSLQDAFAMYGRLLDPSGYSWLGLRENSYVVAAATLLLVLAARPIYERVVVALDSRPIATFLGHVMVFGLVGAVVFVFLRPVAQFIYFAF